MIAASCQACQRGSVLWLFLLRVQGTKKTRQGQTRPQSQRKQRHMQGTQELLSVPWHRADLAPCLSPGTGPLSQWARRGLHSCTHAGQRLEPSTLRGTTVSCVPTVGTGLETGSSSDKALCCGARLNAPFPPGKMLFPPVVHSGPSLACSMSYTHDLPTRFEVAAATISEQLPNPQHMPMVKGTGQR